MNESETQKYNDNPWKQTEFKALHDEPSWEFLASFFLLGKNKSSSFCLLVMQCNDSSRNFYGAYRVKNRIGRKVYEFQFVFRAGVVCFPFTRAARFVFHAFVRNFESLSFEEVLNLLK